MPWPLQKLRKEVRGLTPARLASALVERVRIEYGTYHVAVLYCDVMGPYVTIPGVQCYPLFAQYYRGPYPVICHPPCGPWSKLKAFCKHQVKALGTIAMHQVHCYGGVVEHPLGSSLFREHGLLGATVERINQCDYGHQAVKPTLLYWWKNEPEHDVC